MGQHTLSWMTALLLLGLLLAGAATSALAQQYSQAEPVELAVSAEALDSADGDTIRRGAYLARAADCTACHTASDGPPYAGGFAFETPFGTLYSSNITPDAEHGIGDWTQAEFTTALRQGVGKDGKHLYPAMPYTAYTHLSDEDVEALWTYFQHVEPQAVPNKRNELMWPFSWRAAMWGWNLLFLDDGRFEPDPQQSDRWNRGAYLVTGPGHCGSCHTPRNLAMARKTDQAFMGHSIQGWHAPRLPAGEGTSDAPGLADWPENEIVQFLQTGAASRSAATGTMKEAIHDSLQYLTEDDLRAIATYLKSLRYEDGETVIATAPTGDNSGLSPSVASRPAQSGTAQAIRIGKMPPPAVPIGDGHGGVTAGERLFMDNCQACHLQGQGMPGAFPALVNNSATAQDDPSNLIKVILQGAQGVQTQQDPTVLTMPDFAWRLNDKQVATLASYVRERFGERAPERAQVSPEQVAELREQVHPPEPDAGH